MLLQHVTVLSYNSALHIHWISATSSNSPHGRPPHTPNALCYSIVTRAFTRTSSPLYPIPLLAATPTDQHSHVYPTCRLLHVSQTIVLSAAQTVQSAFFSYWLDVRQAVVHVRHLQYSLSSQQRPHRLWGHPVSNVESFPVAWRWPPTST